MSKRKTDSVLLLMLLCLSPLVVAIAAPALAARIAPALRSLVVCLLGGFVAVVMLWLFQNRQGAIEDASLESNIESFIARGASLISSAVVLCDVDGSIIWVNDAFTAMTGYSLKESVGLKPGKLLQGDATDLRTISEIRHCLSDGRPFSGDILNFKKDGTPFWVHLDIEQIRDAAGQLEAYIGAQSDITERKEIQLTQERELTAALAAADLDALTGLLNHRAFHNALRTESVASKYSGSRLGILLIDLDNFRFFNEAYGHLVGDSVLKQVAETLRSAGMGFGFDSIARFGGDEFAALVPAVNSSEQEVMPEEIESLFNLLGYRLPGYDHPIPISVTVGIAYYPDDGSVISEVLAVADKRLLLAKAGTQDSKIADDVRHSINSNSEGFSMLDALVTAVDNKDRYTRRHSEDVMGYALDIARAIELSEQQKMVLSAAALLHDVGKIGVPDRILRKPGKLTEEEFQAIKQHPQMGAVIVGAVSGFEQTLDAILYHHERWDGKGYPAGLAGQSIPLLARIMAVADGFSAMTTNRPYRSGMSSDEAFKILIAGSGTQWDAELVNALLSRAHVEAA
jgi:diguanylate cyclase (GGDEF)-like protein/PAS domain S-box-containing protein